MRRSLTTIIGLGIVTAIFMALMSVFYLQQIPTREDLGRLESDLRREHGLYLSSTAAIDLVMERPAEEGGRSGLRIGCTLRPDIRKRPRTVELYLGRIADSVLTHPDWRGRVAYVTVAHSAPLNTTLTRWGGGPQTPTGRRVRGKQAAAGG